MMAADDYCMLMANDPEVLKAKYGDAYTQRASALAELLNLVEGGHINTPTAKNILGEMYQSGQSADAIVEAKGLRQISDSDHIARTVFQILDENPDEVIKFHGGKESLTNWFFGQVMGATRGKANPQMVRAELQKQLESRRK